MQSYLDSCRLTGASLVFRRRWLQKKKDLKLGVSKLEEENLHRLIAERGAHRFLRPANAVFYCQPTPFFTAIQRHFLPPANASFYGQPLHFYGLPTPLFNASQRHFLPPANAIFYGLPTAVFTASQRLFCGQQTPVFTVCQRQFLRPADASFYGLPTPVITACQRHCLPPANAVSYRRTAPSYVGGTTFLRCSHRLPSRRQCRTLRCCVQR